MNRLTLDRAVSLLTAARHARILVVGDVMLDTYLQGAALRISPEAPVPVVRVEEEWRALGGAANVAQNVVALGGSCVVAGVVGEDRAGQELSDALAVAGIDGTGLLPIAGRRTTVKTRILARHHQVARYDHESDDDLDSDDAEALLGRIRSVAPDCDAIIIEDYNKGVLTRQVIQGTLGIAREYRKPVVVDPKSRFFFDYQGATLFKPNLPELAAALRDNVRYDDREWMEATRAQLGCETLLLTLGEHGMALITRQGEYLRVPTVARSVYDVSGAGDTVIAVVALALAAQATVEEAAILANHAAGIEVGKAGVATVAPEELLERIAEHAQEN